MTNRIRLTHLTFIGGNRAPATVEFGPRATIVRGPSDTGKSFIVDSIDFMLGATELRQIPQRAGYTSVLLGLILPDETPITLIRAVEGGSVVAHQGTFHSLPEESSTPPDLFSEDPEESSAAVDEAQQSDTAGALEAPGIDSWPKRLGGRHVSRSSANLSRFLLAIIGLDGRLLRRNANNAKSPLTIRDVARLCVVDETRMQDETPPGQSGNPTEQTKEVSALKVFLQDEDDSALVEVPSPKERRKLGEAQAQVLDRLLDELRPEVAEAPSRVEVEAQIARLDGAISAATGSIEGVARARARAAHLLGEAQQALRESREQLAEARTLQARFELLRAQYESDLERLALVSEAGSLIGLFEPGTCVFCGAEPAHQHLHLNSDSGSTRFGVVVKAETDKTSILLEDLITTISDLRSQVLSAASRNAELADTVRNRAAQLEVADAAMAPVKSDLNELVAARAKLSEVISIYDRILRLEWMQIQIVQDAKTEKAVAAEALSLKAVNAFSDHLRKRLAAWGFPDAEAVRFDRNELDIVDGDQMRSDHGKGVRAVLHAAFTVALADHCFAQDTPHPGFVIVDSPLVTYRPPKPGEEDLTQERVTLGAGFADAFYRDLEENFEGQILIMENTDPPLPVREGTVDIEFTKSDAGRYGLFEPIQPPRADGP